MILSGEQQPGKKLTFYKSARNSKILSCLLGAVSVGTCKTSLMETIAAKGKHQEPMQGCLADGPVSELF